MPNLIFRWSLPFAKDCLTRPLVGNAGKPKCDKKRLGFDSYIFLIIPVSGFALGTWQLKRLKWKLALIHDLNKLSKTDPLDLNDIIKKGQLNELKEYNHIKAKGHFITGKYTYYGPKIFIDPKQLDDPSSYKHSSLIGPSRKVGFHMIQAFILSELEISILVNRGWVPKEYLSNLDTKTQDKEVTITGLVRLSQKDFKGQAKTTISLNDSENNVKKEIWAWRDTNKMSQSLGCMDLFIDQDFEDNNLDAKHNIAYPIGGQTNVTLRNQHLSYAITWYGLAFFTGLLWYTRYLK